MVWTNQNAIYFIDNLERVTTEDDLRLILPGLLDAGLKEYSEASGSLIVTKPNEAPSPLGLDSTRQDNIHWWSSSEPNASNDPHVNVHLIDDQSPFEPFPSRCEQPGATISPASTIVGRSEEIWDFPNKHIELTGTDATSLTGSSHSVSFDWTVADSDGCMELAEDMVHGSRCVSADEVTVDDVFAPHTSIVERVIVPDTEKMHGSSASSLNQGSVNNTGKTPAMGKHDAAHLLDGGRSITIAHGLRPA